MFQTRKRTRYNSDVYHKAVAVIKRFFQRLYLKRHRGLDFLPDTIHHRRHLCWAEWNRACEKRMQTFVELNFRAYFAMYTEVQLLRVEYLNSSLTRERTFLLRSLLYPTPARTKKFELLDSKTREAMAARYILERLPVCEDVLRIITNYIF